MLEEGLIQFLQHQQQKKRIANLKGEKNDKFHSNFTGNQL